MSKSKGNKQWFKHDFYSSRNLKLQKLDCYHPMVGYAIYFKIIELMYQGNGWIDYNLELLGYRLNYNQKTISDVIEKFDLFIFEDGKFSSQRVLESIDEINRKSIAARKSAEARWNNR